MTQRFARCARWIVAAAVLTGACGDQGDKAKPAATAGKAEAKAPSTAGENKDGEPKADPQPEPEPKTTTPPPAEGGEPPDEPTPDDADGDEAGDEEGDEDGQPEAEAEAEAEAAGEEEGGDEPDDGGEKPAADGGGKDAAALIKEARTTKTSDERALEALTEAEEAGATVKELARAAKARGDYLYKSPDRALVFYEWSAAKDEDYADPVFALAKQKAVTGDVDDTIKLLKQVAERKGGKKLLQQIDFDPTWDIVKDDPDVRALL